MREKIIITILLVFLLIVGGILFVKFRENKIHEQNKKRYR